MTRSAIITDGSLLVVMAIIWLSAKSVFPRPRDTTQNCETSLYRFLYINTGCLGPDNPDQKTRNNHCRHEQEGRAIVGKQ